MAHAFWHLQAKLLGPPEFVPASVAAFRRYRGRSLALPTQADLRSILTTRDTTQAQTDAAAKAAADRAKQLDAAIALYARLQAAVNDLTSVSTEHLNVSKLRACGCAR